MADSPVDSRCTYRLQLGPGLRFADARGLVPYLRDLGVSHLYLSPSLQARSGSTHGYDVVDPTRISDELGGEDEFCALCNAAHEAGLGVVLDIVPNHMATSEEENPFWRDRSGGRSSSTSTGAPGCIGASSTSASLPECGWRIPRSGRRRTQR